MSLMPRVAQSITTRKKKMNRIILTFKNLVNCEAIVKCQVVVVEGFKQFYTEYQELEIIATRLSKEEGGKHLQLSAEMKFLLEKRKWSQKSQKSLKKQQIPSSRL